MKTKFEYKCLADNSHIKIIEDEGDICVLSKPRQLCEECGSLMLVDSVTVYQDRTIEPVILNTFELKIAENIK